MCVGVGGKWRPGWGTVPWDHGWTGQQGGQAPLTLENLGQARVLSRDGFEPLRQEQGEGGQHGPHPSPRRLGAGTQPYRRASRPA